MKLGVLLAIAVAVSHPAGAQLLISPAQPWPSAGCPPRCAGGPVGGGAPGGGTTGGGGPGSNDAYGGSEIGTFCYTPLGIFGPGPAGRKGSACVVNGPRGPVYGQIGP